MGRDLHEWMTKQWGNIVTILAIASENISPNQVEPKKFPEQFKIRDISLENLPVSVTELVDTVWSETQCSR